MDEFQVIFQKYNLPPWCKKVSYDIEMRRHIAIFAPTWQIDLAFKHVTIYETISLNIIVSKCLAPIIIGCIIAHT